MGWRWDRGGMEEGWRRGGGGMEVRWYWLRTCGTPHDDASFKSFTRTQNSFGTSDRKRFNEKPSAIFKSENHQRACKCTKKQKNA